MIKQLWKKWKGFLLNPFTFGLPVNEAVVYHECTFKVIEREEGFILLSTFNDNSLRRERKEIRDVAWLIIDQLVYHYGMRLDEKNYVVGMVKGLTTHLKESGVFYFYPRIHTRVKVNIIYQPKEELSHEKSI